jgi:hypothetical protein
MTAGAIPVEVLRIKAQGTDVALPAALALPDNSGAHGDDITDLQLHSMGLVGKRACTVVRFQYGSRSMQCAGPIPEAVGNLLGLRQLELSGNALSGTRPNVQACAP